MTMNEKVRDQKTLRSDQMVTIHNRGTHVSGRKSTRNQKYLVAANVSDDPYTSALFTNDLYFDDDEVSEAFVEKVFTFGRQSYAGFHRATKSIDDVLRFTLRELPAVTILDYSLHPPSREERAVLANRKWLDHWSGQDAMVALVRQVSGVFQDLSASQAEQVRHLQMRCRELQLENMSLQRRLVRYEAERKYLAAARAEEPTFGVAEATAEDEGSLATAISAELADSQWDFRTAEGVAKVIGVPPATVSDFFDTHPTLVRWVPATDDNGSALFVDARRPVSRRERLLRIKAALTKRLS
jgi:hypothetical protein